MVDYSPLWETMEKKGISQYQLLHGGIDNKTLDALKHNKNITITTLEKLCRICDCTPNEVLRFIDDPVETPEDAEDLEEAIAEDGVPDGSETTATASS